MKTFKHGSIEGIPTDAKHVQAFRITGHVDDDDMEKMAEHMNSVFDTTDQPVDMLLDLSAMTGRDMDAMFDGDVIRAQFRSWSKVGKYAVIGAPDSAEKLISWSNKVIPVDARTFDTQETDAAWDFVNAKPVAPDDAVQPGQRSA
ncbi:SpoIIAA family protein [Tateyamaria pelophila]|uniref:STAS/SEC14 domain-containing protein n=1 Tax=Tateyamaria pelophila TaxID=328415 RepID=UPI001CBAD9A4|nr:STAS/SEC14 domain-containing protein [Tateyamaria pelophila]